MPEQAENPLLQQLRDIHVPAEIGWWPPAIGWWLLALLIALAGYRLLRRWLDQRQQNQYKKQALLELDALLGKWQHGGETACYLQSVNALLSRVCLHLENGQQLSAQTGLDWADSLNSYSSAQLDQETILALTHAAYKKDPATDVDQVHKVVEHWLKQHKRSPLQSTATTGKQEPDYA